MIAAPVSDLPAPDSPTTPRISPGAIENETSSSATSVPRRPGNSTRSLETSSSGGGVIRRQLVTGLLPDGVKPGGGVQPLTGSWYSTLTVKSDDNRFSLTATK